MLVMSHSFFYNIYYCYNILKLNAQATEKILSSESIFKASPKQSSYLLILGTCEKKKG